MILHAVRLSMFVSPGSFNSLRLINLFVYIVFRQQSMSESKRVHIRAHTYWSTDIVSGYSDHLNSSQQSIAKHDASSSRCMRNVRKKRIHIITVSRWSRQILFDKLQHMTPNSLTCSHKSLIRAAAAVAAFFSSFTIVALRVIYVDSAVSPVRVWHGVVYGCRMQSSATISSSWSHIINATRLSIITVQI